MNTFSVDVEEWFHGVELSRTIANDFTSRVEKSIDVILDLLIESRNKGTFFVLGKVAESNPSLIRKIARHGHEIATHGYSHQKIYTMTPQEFRKELRHSIALLENITGEKVLGHRGAYFSITRKSLWALEILAEEGIIYDSTIHPVYNYRYGIPTANRNPSLLSLDGHKKLLEIPVSTYPINGFNLPVGGGAYFRIYPYLLTKRLFSCLNSNGENVNFYFHPWEIDPGHPKIDLPFRISLTHYINIKKNKAKLRSLLKDFDFCSYRESYRNTMENIFGCAALT